MDISAYQLICSSLILRFTLKYRTRVEAFLEHKNLYLTQRPGNLIDHILSIKINVPCRGAKNLPHFLDTLLQNRLAILNESKIPLLEFRNLHESITFDEVLVVCKNGLEKRAPDVEIHPHVIFLRIWFWGLHNGEGLTVIYILIFISLNNCFLILQLKQSRIISAKRILQAVELYPVIYLIMWRKTDILFRLQILETERL